MNTREKLLQCFSNIGVFVDPKENSLPPDVIKDSLLFVSMIVEMEQEFDIEIPDEYLSGERLLSFRDLEELVELLANSGLE